MTLAAIRAAALALAVAVGAAGGACGETFRFVAAQDYPPFTGKELPGRGLAVAVVKAAIASQGHKAEITLRPRSRAYARTVDGAFDGGFPFPWTPQRAVETELSKPLFAVVPQVISSAERPVRFDGSGASLRGRTLCLPAGEASVALVEEMIDAGRLKTIRPARGARCPELVQLGRADFWVQNNFVWPTVIANSAYSESDFHIARKGFAVIKLHLLVGKDRADPFEMIRIVDDGLVDIRTDGTYQALIDKHIGGE